MDLVIFPGKNTPLKRYRPYFPEWNLRLIHDGETPERVLAHSRGLHHALEFCRKYSFQTRILVMDGTPLQADDTIPDTVEIIWFLPEHREQNSRCQITYQVYQCDPQLEHYPYMVKSIRDRILKSLLE